MVMLGRTISKSTFYSWIYLIALLGPFLIPSLEVNIILTSFFLSFILFESSFKISKTLLNTLTILLCIFIIGFLIHFFYKTNFYDVIKDIAYIIKPIIYVTLGFFVASKFENKDFIFKGIIYLSLLLAIIHLYNITSYLLETKSFQINFIRNNNGKDNFLELMACSLLILNKNNRFFNISFRYKKLVYLILALSFILYFSRTMMVGIFIIILTVKGYAKLTAKSILIIFSLLIATLVFYKVIYSMDIERGADGIEGFLYKLKIAPSEIFSSEINLDDHSERWDHWRAYEGLKAIEQINSTPNHIGVVFGKGFGSLIDLGFEAKLGNESMQYIPKIHNGYVYIFFKTGMLGLLFYILFLINLYLQSYIKSSNEKSVFTNNLISAIAIFYLFSTLIISGIYNPTDVFSLILGALLFLQLQYKKLNENSNYRN